MSKLHQFDIEQLRTDVAAGQRHLRITSHAQTEAFKDGLALADLRYTFEHGDLIEEYPEQNRGSLYSDVPNIGMPVHILIEDTLLTVSLSQHISLTDDYGSRIEFESQKDDAMHSMS